MHSRVWGGAYWYILHAITFAFNENENEEHNKEHFRTIITKIGTVLPCGVCRNHFRRQIANTPIKYNNQEQITTWLYKRHQYVNSILHKKNRPTFQKVEKTHKSLNMKIVNEFFHFFIMSLLPNRLNVYKTIFKLFSSTWPNKSKRHIIKDLTSNKQFKQISKPKKLKLWFVNQFTPYILHNKTYIIPSEQNPSEQKPSEQKPSEQKPSEQNPNEPEQNMTEPSERQVRFAIEENPDKQQLEQKHNKLKKRENHIKNRIKIALSQNKPKQVQNKIKKLNNIKLKIRNVESKIYA